MWHQISPDLLAYCFYLIRLGSGRDSAAANQLQVDGENFLSYLGQQHLVP